MANIVTGKVRLSYVNIFTPRQSQNGGDAKYSVTVLLPKSDLETKAKIDADIRQVAQDALAGAFGGVMPPNLALPIHDGDGVRPSGEAFGPECRGCWVFTASSKTAPQIVDIQGNPIMVSTEVYSGCYGRVSLRFFAYNAAGKKGIGCGLGNVQKLEDGTPLGGGTTAAQDFGFAQAPTFAPQPQGQQQYAQQPIQQTQFTQPPIQQFGQPQPLSIQPIYAPPTAPAQQPTAPAVDPITGLPIGGILGL